MILDAQDSDGMRLGHRSVALPLMQAERDARLRSPPRDELIQPIGTSLFLKRCVHQQIDGRYWLVAGDVALAEIAQKIVGARLWPRRDEAAARLGEFVFHLE